jgi:hypothetical protein
MFLPLKRPANRGVRTLASTALRSGERALGTCPLRGIASRPAVSVRLAGEFRNACRACGVPARPVQRSAHYIRDHGRSGPSGQRVCCHGVVTARRVRGSPMKTWHGAQHSRAGLSRSVDREPRREEVMRFPLIVGESVVASSFSSGAAVYGGPGDLHRRPLGFTWR